MTRLLTILLLGLSYSVAVGQVSYQGEIDKVVDDICLDEQFWTENGIMEADLFDPPYRQIP